QYPYHPAATDSPIPTNTVGLASRGLSNSQTLYQTLSNGQATYPLSSLPAGIYQLTATYPAQGVWAASQAIANLVALLGQQQGFNPCLPGQSPREPFNQFPPYVPIYPKPGQLRPPIWPPVLDYAFITPPGGVKGIIDPNAKDPLVELSFLMLNNVGSFQNGFIVPPNPP